ncbi:hypothetical protein Airi02_039300 [Actinoallomurus iriomotensis]|uniref:Uncharacterized protein n=1 Tax=Actinoallomurus iriomotensis TaxID=478107 RepID=A0A9W6W1I8_9ACTN|nr:hypothetical protein Airi02_039300 [Actinoallomurus iriomotensis]
MTDEGLDVDVAQGCSDGPVVAAADAAAGHAGTEEDACPRAADPRLRAMVTVQDDHLEVPPVPVDHERGEGYLPAAIAYDSE